MITEDHKTSSDAKAGTGTWSLGHGASASGETWHLQIGCGDGSGVQCLGTTQRTVCRNACCPLSHMLISERLLTENDSRAPLPAPQLLATTLWSQLVSREPLWGALRAGCGRGLANRRRANSYMLLQIKASPPSIYAPAGVPGPLHKFNCLWSR